MKLARGNLARAGAAIVAITFLASGCKVIGRIQAGEKVSINPCNLVGLDVAQTVLGGSLFRQLAVSHSPEGTSQFGGCDFGPRSSEEGPTLYIFVEEVTRDRTTDSLESKPLRGVGREARYRYINDDDPRNTLRLVALTTKGAKLTLIVNMVNADEPSLLSKARSLAVPALARMEEVFPGTDKPPRDSPPIPICSTIGAETMIEIYKGSWALPPGKSMVFVESEFFGGPEISGLGPVGGGWACRADIEPHIYGGAGEAYHPHTAWWLSKAMPPAEPPPGSQRVSGLGASATSRSVEESWYFGGKSFVLSVFSKGGHHFEVDVHLEEMDESVGRSIALAVAERILTKLS